MTALLEEAFRKASALPPDMQEQVARQLLEDIEGESKWNESLAKSAKVIDRLAAKALEAHRTGRTHTKGFDEL